MDPGTDFSFFKWLAQLLGPGGFVAAIAAAGEAWFIYKLMGWHYKDRTDHAAALALAHSQHAAALVGKDAEHHKERDDYHAMCQLERKTERDFMDSQIKIQQERFRQLRTDSKQAWDTISGLKTVVGRLAGRKVRSARG